MSNDAMSKDTMSKDSMSKDKMSKDGMKKNTMKHDKMKKGSDAMGMKHEASGAMAITGPVMRGDRAPFA